MVEGKAFWALSKLSCRRRVVDRIRNLDSLAVEVDLVALDGDGINAFETVLEPESLERPDPAWLQELPNNAIRFFERTLKKKHRALLSRERYGHCSPEDTSSNNDHVCMAVRGTASGSVVGGGGRRGIHDRYDAME